MSSNMKSVLAALHTVEAPKADHLPRQPVEALPFITISRQAGAGGRTLAYELVDRLRVEDQATRPWQAFDRELVEKVAAEYNLPEHKINVLTDHGHNWLLEALRDLSMRTPVAHSELAVYRRVAETIISLAELGRVVIVGRGGVYLTRGMPGGLHVRLVAPFDYRVEAAEKLLNVPATEAEAWVRETDRDREAFFRHYWPNRPSNDEAFDLTLNAASFSDTQLVDAIVALMRSRLEQASAVRPVGTAS